MKDDEQLLIKSIMKETNPNDFPYVREMAKALEMHEKRAAYICEKWCRKGWYEYGVNILAGWLTAEGLTEAVTQDQLYDRTSTETFVGLAEG